jgi:benzoyl-CoA-dihydrodiol lyase
MYRHWRLVVEPPLAFLTLAVDEDAGFAPGYKLKLNSYDLGVDIELADAVERLRFEHPEVGAVIVTSAHDRVFSAGANIYMLGAASHSFKVNFCKFTNETRLAIEDAGAHSGQHYIAACNGTTAGGGYELALACEEIYLVDDGHSAVSLPEVALLGVLPGTGGLTRLVDKRRVRRDRADLFATLAEGIKGKRAVEWGLVDGVFPRSRFREVVRERALALAGERPAGPGVTLEPLGDYRHVGLEVSPAARTAELTVRGPELGVGPEWALRAFREIDHALLRLRFEHEEIGLVLLKTRGSAEAVLALDERLWAGRDDWLTREIVLLMARTLRRLDLTGRSFFAVVDPESCFAGSLLELALAADRIYRHEAASLATSPLNDGLLPMVHGVSRLEARGGSAEATVVLDEMDWEDELRVAVEERVSLSPDALTGMEANLRFPGAENAASKIFGRLSAWQNWVFSRPNATGERGALSLYGKPERPQFDWRRT